MSRPIRPRTGLGGDKKASKTGTAPYSTQIAPGHRGYRVAPSAAKMPHPWNDNIHGWENPTTSRAGTISYPVKNGVEGPIVNQNAKLVAAYSAQRKKAGTKGY